MSNRFIVSMEQLVEMLAGSAGAALRLGKIPSNEHLQESVLFLVRKGSIESTEQVTLQ